MEIFVGILVICFVFIIFAVIALFPAWILLLCYDYIAVQVGTPEISITFLNVLCVAVLLAIVGSIFKSK